MSYVVLARKWRPKVFSEVVGQDHIVKSISYSLKSKQTSHAYLFSGTRGVGKTTMARLLAKSLTCLNPKDIDPCNECSSCLSVDADNSLDVIEIDGASHNGVDHMRSIIDTVSFLPTQGRHKVYIIDEIHMLSKEAFNALLKTLESPPSHVVFIFATTVPEKILETILSRCLRYDFRPLSENKLRKHLEKILGQENIHINDKHVLKSLVQEARGSVRDALTLLEQALTYSRETHVLDENILETLGIVKKEYLKGVIRALVLGDLKSLKDSYQKSLANISNFPTFGHSILDEFYQLIQCKIEGNEEQIKEYGAEGRSLPELYWIYETLAKDFSWAFSSFRATTTVEIVLQKIALRDSFFLTSKIKNENKSYKIDRATLIEAPSSPNPAVKEKTAVAEKEKEKKSCDWDGFLIYLKGRNNALGGNLEQGNILSDREFTKDLTLLKVGFNQKSRVFFEFFSNKSSKESLKNFLNDYLRDHYGDDASKEVEVDLSLLAEKEEKNLHFKSVSQIKEEKSQEMKGELTNEILENPILKKIINTFDAKVASVEVKNEESL